MKNIWKRIKFLISLKSVASSVATVVFLIMLILEQIHIVDALNHYFASLAETTKKSIKHSHKHFSDYLANESGRTIFLQPTDKEEIANIISYLNSNKAFGPNSIPCK